ncbi:MAG: hypothetical protein MAG451_02993 [Anaerolineales bacterium]|nr:hypothetical protein [Anaerolineales bacterium]
MNAALGINANDADLPLRCLQLVRVQPEGCVDRLGCTVEALVFCQDQAGVVLPIRIPVAAPVWRGEVRAQVEGGVVVSDGLDTNVVRRSILPIVPHDDDRMAAWQERVVHRAPNEVSSCLRGVAGVIVDPEVPCPLTVHFHTFYTEISAGGHVSPKPHVIAGMFRRGE